ncbi:MAG TPA: hypothetical protein VF331_27115 [Polyangiales bacterium]
MKLFDPHVHMTSRTTHDSQAMAQAGIVAVIEPAFWLGQPRTRVPNSGQACDTPASTTQKLR